MLVDRLVNLLSRGCVLPVVKYISAAATSDTDISLIRLVSLLSCQYRLHCIDCSFLSQIFRHGGAGDHRSPLQPGVCQRVPAAGGERGDHREYETERHGQRPSLRVYRPLQSSSWHKQSFFVVVQYFCFKLMNFQFNARNKKIFVKYRVYVVNHISINI